jgi:hypothetical protein
MKARTILAAVALLAIATAAHAANLDYNRYNWYGVGIHITGPDDVSGGAGQIRLYNNGVLVADAWCMDVFNGLAGGGDDSVLPYALGNIPSLLGVPSALAQTQLDTIANLVVSGDAAVKGGASATTSAEYQVAIWSVEYGAGFAYDSLGGTFASDVSSLIGAASGAAPSGYTLSFLEPVIPEMSQTLVFVTPSAPEASTWAMMLAGFGGLCLSAFRRSRRNSLSAA